MVQEVSTRPINLSLDGLRELFVGSFNSMSEQLIKNNIASESEIKQHVVTLNTQNNIDEIYFGSSYIILGTK